MIPCLRDSRDRKRETADVLGDSLPIVAFRLFDDPLVSQYVQFSVLGNRPVALPLAAQ